MKFGSLDDSDDEYNVFGFVEISKEFATQCDFFFGTDTSDRIH